MKFRKGLFAICLICIIFSISGVMASEVNDDMAAADTKEAEATQEIQAIEQSDNDDTIKQTDDGTFTALQKKINDAQSGTTVTLENDYAYNEGFNTGGISIAKEITIDGNGHKIDGLSKSRIFSVVEGFRNNHEITLKNIVFCNGYADEGGAITASASAIFPESLIIINCEFINNKATESGGAIYNWQGKSLKISGCTFKDNSAPYGGAVETNWHLSTFADCSFIKNSASHGGAVFLSAGSEVRFTGCKFTGNSATSDGGAIDSDDNFVTDYGLTIDSCTFDSNTCNRNGGAVCDVTDALSVKNSKFTNNRASNGGAVYFDGTDGEITGCEFTGNSASSSGGAVYSKINKIDGKTYTAKLVGCTFTSNKAPKDRDVYGATSSNCAFNYLKLTLKSVKVKKSAKKVVLQATLKYGNSPVASKKVTFKFNGKTYKAKTNKNGIAKVTIKKKVLKKLKVGKKVKYQVKYGNLIVKKTAKVKK